METQSQVKMSNSFQYRPGKKAVGATARTNYKTAAPSQKRTLSNDSSSKNIVDADNSRAYYKSTPQDAEKRMHGDASTNLYGTTVPKIVSLAEHLIPTVARQMDDKRNNLSNDIKSTFNTNQSRCENDSPSCALNTSHNSKDDMIDDWYTRSVREFVTPQRAAHAQDIHEDIESGVRTETSAASTAVAKRRHHDWDYSPISPMTSSKITVCGRAARQETPATKGYDHIDINPNDLSVDTIAAVLDSEYQLRQKEADALLADIQKGFQDNSNNFESEKDSKMEYSHDIEDVENFKVGNDDSYDSDDDDLNMEESRLNDIAASLRTEMQLQVMEQAKQQELHLMRHQGEEPQSISQSNDHRSSSRFSLRSLLSSFLRNDDLVHDKTLSVYFGSSGVDPFRHHRHRTSYSTMIHTAEERTILTQEYMQNLYWALALVWAVLILLGRHFQIKGFQSWNDVWDWLLQFGI